MTKTWVDCPICGEDDMAFVPEAQPTQEGQGYISCTNLNCGSNGGDNFAGDAMAKMAVGILAASPFKAACDAVFDRDAIFDTVESRLPPTGLYEILVPTVRRIGGKPYRTRFHKTWDAKVRKISGGLTIMTPVKGQWMASDGELFAERMIPVRFIATAEQAEEIAKMTGAYYDQLAILCYQISNNVMLIKMD